MSIDVQAVGLRQRKKERTRRELLDLALRLFEERGYADVTVEDIAAQADVSPRTLYRYFLSKEDLLFEDASEPLDTLRSSLLAQPMDVPVMDAVRAALLDVTRAYEDTAAEKGRRARIVDATPSLKVRRSERQAAFEHVLTPLIAERIRDRPDAPGLRAQLIAACALAALRVAFATWDSSPATTLPDLVDEALTLLGDGFGDRQEA